MSLNNLGLDTKKLNHGFARGVYFAPLAGNYQEFLRGEQRSLRKDLQTSAEAVTESVKDRWIIPRSIRDPSWRTLEGADLFRSTLNSILGMEVL